MNNAELSRPLRVLHVSPSYARRDGGPSEVLRQLLPALSNSGSEVALISTDKGESELDRSEAETLNHTLAHSRAFPPGLNYATGLLRPLARNIAWADVVHVHSVNSYVTSVAVLLSNISRTPVLLQPHGALTNYQVLRASRLRKLYNSTLDRSILRRVNAILVSSELEASELPPLTETRKVNIPLGVDPKLFTSKRVLQPSVERFALFLGRVTEKKRLDLLLEALSDGRLANLRLKVAGPISPDLSWSPTQRIAELGLGDRVDLLGEVDASARLSLLSESLAFVLPSDDESFGIAAAESMAAGCPTIVSPRVGIATNADRSSDAPIIAEQNPAAIASQLYRLASDNILTAKVSKESRDYAKEHFGWPYVSKQLILTYRELL